jgi:hypothetical protein
MEGSRVTGTQNTGSANTVAAPRLSASALTQASASETVLLTRSPFRCDYPYPKIAHGAPPPGRDGQVSRGLSRIPAFAGMTGRKKIPRRGPGYFLCANSTYWAV